MTSSPGPTPQASKASQSASVPLPTPMACRVPQKAANSFSNCATNGPPAKAPLSMTSPMARSISARRGAWCALRSRNGTFVCMISAGLPEDFGRISSDGRARWDVSRDDAPGSDQSIFPDGDSAQQGRARANGCAALHVRLLTFPVASVWGRPAAGRRARAAIVDENYTMSNEDLGFDRDTLANESVTRNLTTLTAPAKAPIRVSSPISQP